jgi:hypothetical protein
MWKLPDGTIISSPRAINIDGVQYPSSIFRSWSADELSAIGIYRFREEPYDVYFYRSSAHTDVLENSEVIRRHTLVDAMTLSELQYMTIVDIKTTANNMLLSTDWYVIRKSEAGDEIPQDVLTYRTAVRQASNDIEIKINGYTTYSGLVSYITTEMNGEWPTVSG